MRFVLPKMVCRRCLCSKIAKFVNWPDKAFAETDDQIVLGILGEDPFGKKIDILENKIIKEKRIQISRFENVDDIRFEINAAPPKQADLKISSMKHCKKSRRPKTRSFCRKKWPPSAL